MTSMSAYPTQPMTEPNAVRLVTAALHGERTGPDEGSWQEGDDVLHDVGNALTAALAYTQLLRLHPSPCVSPRELKALRAIETNVIHAAKLLTGQAVSEPAAVCDVVALTREAIEQVPPQRAGDVVVQWPEEIRVTACGDPLVVARTLANLLDNAAKYSWPGTPIEISLQPGNSGIEIVVRDRGIGVPEADLEAIFAGHRTAQALEMAPGHGLGLRSSRRLVKEVGGRLWATNETDGVTAFHLWLPAPHLISNAGQGSQEECHG